MSDNIGFWKLENASDISVGDFNNVSNKEKCGVCPGSNGDSAYTIKTENPAKIKKLVFCEDGYLYYKFGKDYFYGITKEYEELLAGISADGSLVPVLQGAGRFMLTGRGGVKGVISDKVKAFIPCKSNGYDAVKVSYVNTGDCEFTKELSSTYIFKEECVSVEISIDLENIADGCEQGSFVKTFLNDFEVFKKRISYDWIYPENNDFVYKDVDALALSYEFDEFTMYSFARKLPNREYIIKFIKPESIPVGFVKNSKNYRQVFYNDITFVKKTANESYIALFKSRNSDFATGISLVEKNDNTTLIEGKQVDININVTNIAAKSIIFSAKYNIIDYYGNIIEEKIIYNSTLKSGEQANRNLKMSLESYGMFYLNYYISSSNYEYRECFPFATVPKYDFKYKEISPFGIGDTHSETPEQGESIAALAGKMGIALVRIGRAWSFTQEEEAEKLEKHGVKRFISGHIGYNRDINKTANIEELFVKDKYWIKKSDYYVMANEIDSGVKANYDMSRRLIKNEYKPCFFEPAYAAVQKHYSEYIDKMSWQANCHATLEWLEAFYEEGIWDKSSFIDVHSYSSPSGPDKCFSNKLHSMYANTFSNEYACVRWKRACRRYGNKRLFVGETGYPTPALDRREIDIRTQADFNTRIALFFLEAGAEAMMFYGFLDRTSYGTGVGLRENEMNFGACYNYDYYGVFMPKPWAVAYANITRRFDGVVRCAHNAKYEEDEVGTLRAFDVETKDNGCFTVLWSNIYLIPNTTADGRVNNVERPAMPAWESRWIKKETRVFDAVGDTVTVVDIMGNERILKSENGKVSIEVSGSPIYVYGIE